MAYMIETPRPGGHWAILLKTPLYHATKAQAEKAARKYHLGEYRVVEVK